MSSVHERLLGPSVERLGLPPVELGILRARGIVSLAQLVDVALRSEEQWARCLTGSLPCFCQGQGMGRVASSLPSNILDALRGVRFAIPPLTGIAGPTSASADLVRIRTGRRGDRKRVVQAVERIARKGTLPSKSLLVDYLSGVGDQGRLGSCTGWGSTGSREFNAQQELAPLFAYAMAKFLDGRPDLVGSWQYYAFAGFVRFGQLRERDYPYTDEPAGLDIKPHIAKAAEFLATDFGDVLLDPEDMGLQPTLMKAILSGRFSDKLGPQPVSVSIAVHESFNSPSTALYGTVQVPGKEEACLGGHAMCCVGYVDGDDPDAVFGQDYFVVKNSWGTAWAAQNPLGFPGHALVPAQYFADSRLLWEALVCVAEPSPAPVRVVRPPLAWMRTAWDPAHLPTPANVCA